jgi:HlyD family secretion protein
MDREIAPEVRRRTMLRKGSVAAVAVLVAFTLIWTLVGWVRPALAREEIRTAKVERGALEATIVASGVVVPSSEKVVSSPIDARVLRVLRTTGASVVAGDPLVELDLEGSRLAVARLDQQIAQRQNEELRLSSNLGSNLVTLQSSIEQKKLDLEMLGYRAEQNRKLRAEGLVSEEVLREATVAEKKAAIELRQLEAALASARRESGVQIGSARLEREMLERDRSEAARQLELATARSDRAGVVTWITPTEGALVRSGDVLARIADLSGVRVEGSVSDVHARAVRSGMETLVRADGKSFRGRIASVAPAVVDGVVKFIVELEDPTAALHSQQRVDVDIITARKRGVLKVRKGAFDPGDRTRLFVIEGNRAVSRSVELGLSGTDEYEIKSGLAEGDEVVLSDMRRYAELDQVRVK